MGLGIGSGSWRKSLTISAKLMRQVRSNLFTGSRGENSVNFSHNLWRELVNEIDRLHILVHLIDPSRTGHYGAHPRVLQTPGQ